MGIAENVIHIVMQRPAFEGERESMCRTISKIDEPVDKEFREHPDQAIYWLLGKTKEGVLENAMVFTWLTAGQSIMGMYKEVLRTTEGFFYLCLQD